MLFLYVAVGIFGGYVYWKIVESAGIFRDRSDPTKVRGGGIVLLPVILWYLLRGPGSVYNILAWIVLAIGVMGLLDDYRGISGYIKAAVSLVAALLLMWSLGWVVPIRFFGYDLYLPFFNEVFWVLFFVGFVNAFNVIDGKDGVLLMTAIVLLSYLHVLTREIMYLHTAAVAVGLLTWNSPPARLIMGDTGSYVLGIFITSAFILLPNIPVEVKLLALSFPLVDTLTTIVRRLRRGQSIFQADKEHIHHVLYSRFGDRWGLFLIMLINLVSVALAHLYTMYGQWVLVLGFVWWGILSLVAFSGPKLADTLH